MSKRFFALAFAVGLAAIAWVGTGFAGSNWSALAMTVVIGAVYLLGAFELRQFRATTAALQAALDKLTTAPATLGDWLAQVPPVLRNPVRLRIEGERIGLPAPALTPYLVGLLVMLGMLGTFLGMVVTFQGVLLALERSTELQAIRAALAEPIRGLGLSFGTSVAGVAGSAMLGLMSALARRERLEVGRELDARIATVLRPFSLTQQRQEAFQALQSQARALPQVVEALQALMERMERRGEQLDQQLLERHAGLQREVGVAYGRLADDVGATLRGSVTASAAAAGAAIAPLVQDAMTRIVQETQGLQGRMGEVAQAQVETLSQRFAEMAAALERRSAAALEQHGERMDQLAGAWRTDMAALRQQEGERGEAAVRRLDELQEAVARHLATLGAALEAPLSRLLQTASEVPQAAAGVITQLRTEMSRLAERDNLALEERAQLLGQLGAVLEDLQVASGGQRAAIESMVASASRVLEEAGARFAQALAAQAGRAADAAAHISAGAVELTGVGEAFGQAVALFQASNEKLTACLQDVESSLQRSTARSDEQLAYYVAQAREVIDLSIASQQGLVENLRQLHAQPAKPLALAAGGRG